MTNWKAHDAVLLESANLRKLKFFSKIQKVKMFAKKMIKYTFLKSPWPCHFKYVKKKFKIFLITWRLIKEKNVQISFVYTIVAKFVQLVSLCHRLLKKLKIIKIWELKMGQNNVLNSCRKKYSFRQCARCLIFQAVSLKARV